MMRKIIVSILSGEYGSRLWPILKENCPKPISKRLRRVVSKYFAAKEESVRRLAWLAFLEKDARKLRLILRAINQLGKASHGCWTREWLKNCVVFHLGHI
jgi:hypothetical protein